MNQFNDNSRGVVSGGAIGSQATLSAFTGNCAEHRPTLFGGRIQDYATDWNHRVSSAIFPSVHAGATETVFNGGAFYDSQTSNGAVVDGIAEGLVNGSEIQNGGHMFPASAPVATANMPVISPDEMPACFLRGGLIRTPAGERYVETLRRGDAVVVLTDGREEVRRLIWTGAAEMRVRQDASVDEAGYPVCIQAGAFGDNRPYRDLLVTADHRLFMDGTLIPARTLINGTTISYATDITAYDFYHVETADHSVVFANGLPTESYRDTGNRQSFRENEPIIHREPQAKDWHVDAAAPLLTDHGRIEALHTRLARRAEKLGYPTACTTVPDPDPRLRTSSGLVFEPMRHSGRSVLFQLPEGLDHVFLLSRSDHHQQGLLVGTIRFWGDEKTFLIEIPEPFEGWHKREKTSCRWTNGAAIIPLICAERSAGVLEVEILSAGPYPVRSSFLQD